MPNLPGPIGPPLQIPNKMLLSGMMDDTAPTRRGNAARHREHCTRHERLATLQERIRQVEAGETGGSAATRETAERPRHVPTGWAKIDAALAGGLAVGRLHEWLGVTTPPSSEKAAHERAQQHGALHRWRPPLCLMAHLARQAVVTRHNRDAPHTQHDAHHVLIVWIGARCRPFWPMLARLSGANQHLVHQSVFVNTQDPAERLWATDLALRCPTVAAVIADASAFQRAETRRLQLAAENGSALALLVRPPDEHHELTTASTRWLVAHEPVAPEQHARCSHNDSNPRWTVGLLRCKGVRPTAETAHAWLLEWAHETGDVRSPADVANRSGPAAHPSITTQSANAPHQRRSA